MTTRKRHPGKKQLRRRIVSSSVKKTVESFADRDRLVGEFELQLTRHRLREQELLQVNAELVELSNYRAGLFNAAPVGYVILNRSGRICDINEAGAELLKTSRQDLLNESIERFVPGKSLANFLNHLRKCKPAGRPAFIDLNLRLHDGSLVPVGLVTVAFVGPEDRVRYRTIIVDATERRLSEAALRESQRNYHDLVNSIEGIVWEANASGFTFVSQQAEVMLGYPLVRWLREPQFWQSRIHPDDRDQVLRARAQAFQSKKDFAIEFRVYDSQRQLIWLRDSVKLIDTGEEILKLRGVMVNITDLKQAEESLREKSNSLEALNHIGIALAAELDLERLVAVVAAAGKEVTGAQFGAFSYKDFAGEGNGKHFSIHVTPGTPREIFGRLPIPSHRLQAPASEAEKEILRIADTLNDSRSPKPLLLAGPSSKEPAVRSYLAVPVVSRSGEVLGGLLFGHPKPGIFSERSQHLVAGIAAQAAVALDNARLYRTVTESASHFRQLADSLPQIVWTAQPDGTVDYLNRRWYEFTGQPAGHINEKGWLPFLHADDSEPCSIAWRLARDSGQPFQSECRLKEKSRGTYRWHLVRAVPIRDESGRILSWFGTCTNIDEQKRSEHEARDLNTVLERRVSERTTQLEGSNKELEAFSYSVSHDLRAPLRTINAFSQLIREDYNDKLDEQGKHYLTIIGESAMRMGQLIDDLLHLSRVSRTGMRRQKVNLSGIVQHIIDGLRELEPQRQIDVTIAPDHRAEGDERLLCIVLENLVNNAWKFTGKLPRGSIEFGVEKQSDDTRAFFIRDNGAGFDMSYADKLFGAFQRLHSAEDFPGHGIGLATVQRIINRHGGRIWANAAVNQGATFYFTLPPDAG